MDNFETMIDNLKTIQYKLKTMTDNIEAMMDNYKTMQYNF